MGEKNIDKVSDEIYLLGIKIGVLIDESGKTPSHFIDREAHRTFVKNIFETSPYNCNQD